MPAISSRDADAADTTVRVLVAEDQPEVRALIQRVLERAGYEVMAVHDGHDAVTAGAAPGGNFDVVVTDYDMPGLRGDAVAAALRAAHPALPIVLMCFMANYLLCHLMLSKPEKLLIQNIFGHGCKLD